MTQVWDFLDYRTLWGKKRYVSDTLIEDLEMSTRARSALHYYSVWGGVTTPIETLGQLVRLTESELLRQPNCGRKTLAEIKEMLAEYGLHLQDPHARDQLDGFVLSNLVREIAEK
jgi:DNA-directed RNA polymerase alpha subunit